MSFKDVVFEQVDIVGKKLSEHEVSGAVRTAYAPIDGQQPPMEVAAEAMAFDFSENYGERQSPWGTFFGPMFTWNNQDGTTTESPNIKDITPDIIEYWKQRTTEVKHPVLRARYANLVWDFSKEVTGTPSDVSFARTLVDSIVEIVKTDSHKYNVDVIKKLERALSIAIGINDQARITAVKDAVLAYEDLIAEDDKPGLWGFSFDYLMDQKKVVLSEAEKQKIIHSLEGLLTRLGNPLADGKVNAWAIEAATLRLATYYRRKNQPTDVKRVLLVVGSAFEKAAEAGSPLQASAWYQHVAAIFQQYGLREEADKLLVKLREIGHKMNDELKRFEHKVEIPQERIDAYVENFAKGPLEVAMARISFQFAPKKDETEAQVKELAAKFPLTYLFTKQLQDHKGRPVAMIGSVESDLAGHVVSQMSQNMSLSGLFLHLVLEKIIDVYKIDRQKLTEVFFASPIFDSSKRGIIEAGLDAYFVGDYLVATHILVPQIEDAVRNLIELTGGTVMKSNRVGGLQLKTFDELLREEVIAEVFGEDIALYLRVLFTDQRGWNVRNNVCHGIFTSDVFQKPIADRVIHALIILSQIRHDEGENNTSMPPKEDFITKLRSKYGKKVDSCILLLFALFGIIHSTNHPIVNDPKWSWLASIGEKAFGAIFIGVTMEFIDERIKSWATTKK